MKAAVQHKQGNETQSRSTGRPFFAKSAENSFFSHNQSGQPFFPAAQPKLTVGQPGDKYEQEADATAEQVMRKQSPQISPVPSVVQAQTSSEEEREETLQTKSEQPAVLSGSFENQLRSTKAEGKPLDADTLQFMGSRFNADFGGVRVHTGRNAVQMNKQLGAQAFAYGNNIYFNEGKYNPATGEGKQLIAHELTHTLQQGASLQRKKGSFSATPVRIQAFDIDLPDIDLPDVDLPDLSIDAFRDKLGDYADDYLPAYSLLSVTIGYDLIRGKSVDRNRDNIIKGIFSLINPFGSVLHQRLQERGIIDDAFVWIKKQLEDLGLTYENVKRKFDEFWDEKEIVRTDFLEYNLNLLKRKFGPFISSIKTFVKRVADKVFTLVKDAFLKLLAGLARKLGGYDLLADLLGQDPITGEERNATTADILRGILKLPVIQAVGGNKLLIKLEQHNLIEKAANWIDTQWALLQGSFANIYNIAVKFLTGFTWETLKAPMAFVNDIKVEVIGFVTKITTFFRNVSTTVLKLIKEALTSLLKRFINERMYGYELVKVILGEDPITKEPFPRNPENIICAFLSLLPNGRALCARLRESGAVQRAASWVMEAIQEFVKILGSIKQAFLNLWKSASIDDLFEPVPFFTTIVQIFAKPVKRAVAFIKRVLIKIFEILLQLMKIPLNLVRSIITHISQAYASIRRDPMGFLLNLLGAVKLGFEQFFNNFLGHLLAGVKQWLFGQLENAGIQPPPNLSFRSVLSLVMKIFGITVNNVLKRLEQKIGPERMERLRAMKDRLKGIWAFVRDVIERGPVAIWEYIQQKISNLWDMIVEGIQNWIVTRIIEKVTVKLMSMLDPTGIMAVVNGFQSFFRAVQSLGEQLREMLEVVNAFVAGVAEIARGSIAQAGSFLENALARALPVAIAFLANQVGLRGLGKRIAEIIEGVRAKVNQAIDWLLDKAFQAGKGVLNKLRGREEADRETEQEKELRTRNEKVRDINLAIQEGNQFIKQEDSEDKIREELHQIKKRYGLKELRMVIDRTNEQSRIIHLEGEINPVINGEEIEIDVENYLLQVNWPPYNLNTHEAMGGHTVSKHIDVDDAFLQARLMNENPGDLEPRSRWNSPETAENVIFGRVIEPNRFRITRWLLGEGPHPDLNYRGSKSSPIGLGYVNIDGQVTDIDLWNARVIIRQKHYEGKPSYYILTAFPTDL